MNSLTGVVVLSLLLTGCANSGSDAAAKAHAPAPENAKQLSGSEIQSVVIGRKHSSVTSTGHSFSETLNPDGTATIEISGDGKQRGSWVITDNIICVSYQKYGKECNIVRSDGNSIWFVDSEKHTTNNKFSSQ